MVQTELCREVFWWLLKAMSPSNVTKYLWGCMYIFEPVWQNPKLNSNLCTRFLFLKVIKDYFKTLKNWNKAVRPELPYLKFFVKGFSSASEIQLDWVENESFQNIPLPHLQENKCNTYNDVITLKLKPGFCSKIHFTIIISFCYQLNLKIVLCLWPIIYWPNYMFL